MPKSKIVGIRRAKIDTSIRPSGPPDNGRGLPVYADRDPRLRNTEVLISIEDRLSAIELALDDRIERLSVPSGREVFYTINDTPPYYLRSKTIFLPDGIMVSIEEQSNGRIIWKRKLRYI